MCKCFKVGNIDGKEHAYCYDLCGDESGRDGRHSKTRAKPFITTTDILCSDRNFIIFLDRDSHGLIK